MNTADAIIDQFGGQSALASLIGKRQSTVQYWSHSGIIPAKWQSVLLELATKQGIELSPNDFVAAGSNEPSTNRPKRTIVEAIRQVLADRGEAMSAQEIFNEIVAKKLYVFHTDNPIGVVTNQLRRHCRDLDFESAHDIKHFRLCDGGKYFLLENSVHVRRRRTDRGIRRSPSLRGLKELHREYQTNVRHHLLDQIRKLDPTTFEIFGKKLLEAYGFEKMVVTRPSRDGGVDGHGRLKIGLAHMKAAFQCKNWRGTVVGRVEVDKFRGATQGQYEQAILFTTSRFTSEATDASFRPGAIPVILIDGPGIVDIMIEKNLGIQCEYLPLYNYALDMVVSGDESGAT